MNLIPHQAFFFCRRGHPLLKTVLRSPDVLLQFRLILPTLPEWLVTLFCQMFKQTGGDLQFIEKITSTQCNDFSVMKNIVANSNCIGMATYGTLGDELNKKLFVALPFGIPKLKTNYGILKKKGLSLSPAASALVDILVEIDAALSEQEASLIESLGQTSQ